MDPPGVPDPQRPNRLDGLSQAAVAETIATYDQLAGDYATLWGGLRLERALRTFGSRIPGMEGIALDEVIMALGESATPDVPLYIEVDQGDNGEKVEVYIG